MAARVDRRSPRATALLLEPGPGGHGHARCLDPPGLTDRFRS
ncbi:hypothetical protein AB0G55_01025 [Streptomyces toyocaensis]